MNECIDCKYKKKCGSCKYIGIPYDKEIKIKYESLKKLLLKYKKVDPIITMDNPYNYRNKVHMAIGTTKNNEMISGLYELSTHNIVKVDYCLLDDTECDEIILTIKKLSYKYKLYPYDEIKEKGLLRHVLIRKSFSLNEIMVTLVLYNNSFKLEKEFINELTSIHNNIKTVVININHDYTSMILGEKEYIAYGNGYIVDKLCDLKFRISSKSFYQVNSIQAERLYNKVIEEAKLSKNDVILDAYSGTGTIGLIASKYVKKVFSVELNKDAIKDGIENSKLNKVQNVCFINEDATKYINYLAYKKDHIDLVIMDPPRTGSTNKFIDSLILLKPKRIIYVSCNPLTLKRDLDYLLKYNKYEVKSITPFDMFPHTEHVESVCQLSLKEIKK